MDFMQEMPDKCVDLVLTDPPYGMEFRSNYRKIKYEKIVGDNEYPVELIKEFERIAKKAVYIFCRWDNLSELPKPKSVLVWIKNNWSMGDLQHEHGRQWEAICFYPQAEHEFITRIPDVIKSNRTGNTLHPTEKPVDLIKKLLQANKGDLIFDPFMGSWTTAVACKQLKRNFIGCEISPEYCEIGRQRLRQEILI
ncbi:MAG: site-specific DNA-methyltransferase [Bacteroidetes bacterium]|nr:site-specific DNA-methyltransferase [Bacteroidota bacterium]